MQRVSRGRIINISSTQPGVSGFLSNFTLSPFVLDGIRYQSFEGFWQSLKFPERHPDKLKAQGLHGIEAKRISAGINTKIMHYHGRQIPLGSRELFELAKRAQRERFLQNPEQKQALLSTGNARLIHFAEFRDSKSLPRKVFCQILTELREEFRRG